MKVKIKILTMLAFMMIVSSLNADTLFEIKDAQDSTVFQISNDGLSVVAIQAIKELKQENEKLNKRLNDIEEILKKLSK